MTEFESEPVTSESLMRQISALRVKVTEEKEKHHIFDRQYKQWSDRETDLLKQLETVRDLKNKAREERAKSKECIRDSEWAIRKLEREYQRQLLLEAEANKFTEVARQLDIETAGRPWREFAYDHQIVGAKRLAFVKRGFLGDKMGLGKTLTSIIWADMVKAKRVLVFAPKETLSNFEREIKHWAGEDRAFISLVGHNKSTRSIFLDAIKLGGAEQYIITVNLEAWRRDEDLIPDLISINPDTVIIDESHAIKKSTSIAFKGIKELVYANNQCPECNNNEFSERYIVPPGEYGTKQAWACTKCEFKTWDQKDICSVKNVLPMTGTPILNKPQELWPILFLIDKKMYPRERAFLDDFCVQACPEGCYYSCPHTKRWKFRQGGLEELSKKIGGQIVMRDRHSAGIIIPPQEVQMYNLNFSKETYPEQWFAYMALARHAAVLLESDKVLTVPSFIALLTRFRQMMTWPAGIELKNERGEVLYRCNVQQSIKLDKAEELAKQLIESGEKVVLFSQFKNPLHELHRRLNGAILDNDKAVSSVILDGSTSDYTKEEIKNDFDAMVNSTHDKFDIVLCNYRVGGQSLNFTAAAHTIILDEEWNPGKRDQAYARTDRMGQTRDTTVHLLRCVSEDMGGTMLIDEFMAGLMDEKENLVEGFESTAKISAQKILDILKKTIEEG
jgi:SNF2 family DNA or RNA helicase